ncbi:MAG: restriction endonuclease subunit S [Bacteroidota bacterium]|nr:restriction endonuclease subunit S [Bacteroidota bacterium]
MKYNKYKSTDIDWLGEVPLNWSVKRVKDIIVKIGSGVTPKGGSEVYLKSGVPLLRSQNVYDEGLRIEDVSFIDETTNHKMKNSQLKPNDILINLTGASIGRTCIVPYSMPKANINQHIIFLRLNKKLVPFISSYFKTHIVKEYINLIQAGTSKEALNMGQTLNVPIILPPIYEQETIAQYLSIKTQSINKKITLLKQKTNYYKELRRNIINEAVCKGLDKSVKSKTSEYLFSVNSNWDIYRLKDLGFLYSGLSGKSGNDFNQDNNPNNKDYIPFTNIANNTNLDITNLAKVVVLDNEKQNKVRKGDLFFLMSSEGYEDVGKTSILKGDLKDTYLNSFCKGYRLNKNNCEPNYLNYLLLSDNYRKSLIIEGKGFTRINLKMEKLTDFFVYLPPTIKEQNKIVVYLDETTKKIDSIIDNITKQIKILNELRKTLINDVAIGKIKVTNN